MPALVDGAGSVLGAEDAVVLFLLHREVGPQDLLERVLLGGLLERVVGPVTADRLVVHRFPGQFLDLLVGLCHTLATHVSPLAFHSGRMRRPPAALVARRPGALHLLQPWSLC